MSNSKSRISALTVTEVQQDERLYGDYCSWKNSAKHSNSAKDESKLIIEYIRSRYREAHDRFVRRNHKKRKALGINLFKKGAISPFDAAN